MRFSGRGRALALLAALAATLPAAPAGADWLVLADGGQLETQGPWKVEEGLVVFRLADGSLASMRASEVDFAASAEATAAASAAPAAEAEPEKAPAAPPRKAVIVLTDADFRHVDPAAPAAAAADAASSAETGGSAEEAEAAARLAVTSWQEQQAPGLEGVRIAGRLANTSSDVILDVSLRARLRGEDGEELATVAAQLTATSLSPETSANFVANFPGVFVYSTVEFEPDGFPLASQEGAEPGGPRQPGSS